MEGKEIYKILSVTRLASLSSPPPPPPHSPYPHLYTLSFLSLPLPFISPAMEHTKALLYQGNTKNNFRHFYCM